MTPSRWLLILAALGLGGLVILLRMSVSMLRPDRPGAITGSLMYVIKERIRIYYERNGKLPQTLGALPILPEKTTDIVDETGLPISYRVLENEHVRLAGAIQGDTGAMIVSEFSLSDKAGKVTADWVIRPKRQPIRHD